MNGRPRPPGSRRRRRCSCASLEGEKSRSPAHACWLLARSKFGLHGHRCFVPEISKIVLKIIVRNDRNAKETTPTVAIEGQEGRQTGRVKTKRSSPCRSHFGVRRGAAGGRRVRSDERIREHHVALSSSVCRVWVSVVNIIFAQSLRLRLRRFPLVFSVKGFGRCSESIAWYGVSSSQHLIRIQHFKLYVIFGNGCKLHWKFSLSSETIQVLEQKI